MGAARLDSASYGDRRLQSFLFKHDNDGWLEANEAAGRRLIQSVSDSRNVEDGPKQGSKILRNISVSSILRFLSEYRFHEDHDELRSDLLSKYIRSENARGSLTTWNIAVMGRSKLEPALGNMDLGFTERVACINRSRYRKTEPCSIKALTSRPDRIVDVPGGGVDRAGNDDQLVDIRNSSLPGVGLLLLYP